jgi:hypothetical protein
MSFFSWSLYSLSFFDLRLLVAVLVSSNFLCHSENNITEKISEIRWTIYGRVDPAVEIWLMPLLGLITGGIMPSWTTCWLLALWCHHWQRFDNLHYDGVMGSGLIKWTMMASWAADWLLTLWCCHGQQIDYLRYDGVMDSGLINWTMMASWVACRLLALEWLRG